MNITKEQRDTAMNAWRLCNEVPMVAYFTDPPEEELANTVTRCLFMITAHESDGFIARRQYGFSPNTMGGAFGLWQCEMGAIERAITAMSQRDRWNRCCAWLRKEGMEMPMSTKDVLMAIQKPTGDALACLLTRWYHLLIPAAIPSDMTAMAAYCKQYHNTEAGSATPEKYLKAYAHWLPVVTEGAQNA